MRNLISEETKQGEGETDTDCGMCDGKIRLPMIDSDEKETKVCSKT